MLEQFHLKLLKARLNEKTNKNPHYSLRAFARDLNLPPGALSEILHGKREIPSGKIDDICTKLDLSKEEKKEFVNSAILSRLNLTNIANIKKVQNKVLLKINQARDKDKQFENFIKDWEYYAILNIIETQPYSLGSIDQISLRLGLKPFKTRKMIFELIEFKFLKINENDILEREISDIETTTDVKCETLIKAHQNLLKLSNAKLNLPLTHRDFQAITFKMDKTKMPQAKKLIREFIENFSNYFEEKMDINSDETKEVYQFNLQLYPLSEFIIQN